MDVLTYTLAGHSFALTRALDTGLTSDQASTTASGAQAPWSEGAQVWLSAPSICKCY